MCPRLEVKREGLESPPSEIQQQTVFFRPKGHTWVQAFASQDVWQLHVEDLTALVGHEEVIGMVDQADPDHVLCLVELRDLA